MVFEPKAVTHVVGRSAASARSSKASIIPQGCDERSGDVDTGHGTFEAVARRKEHCGLVYEAIRQFDPSEPMA